MPESENEIFHLLLEDEGVITEVEMRTLSETSEDIDLGAAFKEGEVISKAIIHSSFLKDAVSYLYIKFNIIKHSNSYIYNIDCCLVC